MGKRVYFCHSPSKDDVQCLATEFCRFSFCSAGIGMLRFYKLEPESLVNAFKTSKGLPMFKATTVYIRALWYKPIIRKVKRLDPRLFSTVAMGWFSLQIQWGFFSRIRESNPKYTVLCFIEREWVDPSCIIVLLTFSVYANSMNKITCFADVLLMIRAAEALIELNREPQKRYL